MSNLLALRVVISKAIADKKVQDSLGWLLIICSSLLLSIWAVRGTIALRNILLVLGASISLIYCINFFKNSPAKIRLINWTPFILIVLMFFWVITHYAFFSRFPEQQFREIISTWMRSLLAVTLALGTGVALAKRPAAINCLWLGLLASFAYLAYQYILKAISTNSVFAIDYSYYIYPLKISGVLSGTIMVGGLLGTFLDTARRATSADVKMVGLLALIGTGVALYASVFIFDSRNGVGLVGIIVFVFFLSSIARLIAAVNARISMSYPLTVLLFAVFSIILFAWICVHQVKHNSGWESTWEDAKIAVQVTQYPNWQNLSAMGYPTNTNGKTVKSNTYERVAWATAGLTIFLPKNPLGVGLLRDSFASLLKEENIDSPVISGTHSAWVDIALAFGYPGLFLLFTSLIALILLSVKSNSRLRSTVAILSLSLLLLYAVGEVSSQHSIEILCYFIVLNSTLLLPIQSLLTQVNVTTVIDV